MTTDPAHDDTAPGDKPGDEEEREYYRHPVHGFKIVPIKGGKVPTEEERKRVVWIGTYAPEH